MTQLQAIASGSQNSNPTLSDGKAFALQITESLFSVITFQMGETGNSDDGEVTLIDSWSLIL